ncbi:MAG TPA: SLATT domain-containing protein [Solimonas sp.]
MQETPIKFLSELRTTAWRTAGARYNASRRLRGRDRWGTVSIAFISVFSISLTILQKVYGIEIDTPLDRFITAASIVSGLGVVVISLVEWGSTNAINAVELYKNAEALNAFQRRLGVILSVSEENIDGGMCAKLAAEYESIKSGCSVNHEPVDDRFFLASKRNSPEFVGKDGRPSMSLAAAMTHRVAGWASALSYFWVIWVLIIGIVYYGVHLSDLPGKRPPTEAQGVTNNYQQS